MKTKGIVVLHIDALRREYFGTWLLGQRFKLAGYKVIYTSRHSTTRLLKVITPDILISTHVFLMRPAEWKALVSRGTKVYINEVEGTDHEFGVSTTYPLEYDKQLIDYSIFSAIFVWGDFSYNWILRNRNVNLETVYLNGSIRQSRYCRPERKTDEIVVGVLSRFEIINVFDGRHPFINLLTLDPEDEGWRWYYERCVIDSETFSIVTKLIRKIIKSGHKVSIRAHPNENLKAYSILTKEFGDALYIDRSYSINEWLSQVSVVVGTTSTAFTEPYLARIPIISTSDIQNFHYSGKDQAGIIDMFDKAGYTPATISEAAELCLNVTVEPKRSEHIDEYFNGFYSLKNQIDPIEKIVAVVDADTDKANKRANIGIRHMTSVIFLVVLDILVTVKNAASLQPIRNIAMSRNYNYNRLFHRPSSFMKTALRKIQNAR